MPNCLAIALTAALFTATVSAAQLPAPSKASQSQSLPTPKPATSAPSMMLPEDKPEDKPEADAPREDWTTIELAKSNLPMQDFGGFLINSVQMDGGCTRELRRMQWRTGDPIDLYIVRPPHEGKLPAVLFLYNYTYDTDLFREDRWCSLAKRNGYLTAGFGSALSLQRFHAPRPLNQWFVSQLQEALASSTHDVQMVLNYLASRDDIDMQHIGMFGQGSGGAIAILAAAADARIGVLDVMDPWGDWPEWLKGSAQIPEEERAAYLKPEFLAKVSTLDPVTYLPRLADRRLRVQQVLSDPITPAAAKDKLASSVPSGVEIMRFADIAAAAKSLGSDGIVGWLGVELKRHDAQSGTR